jgi:hypothetical protein
MVAGIPLRPTTDWARSERRSRVIDSADWSWWWWVALVVVVVLLARTTDVGGASGMWADSECCWSSCSLDWPTSCGARVGAADPVVVSLLVCVGIELVEQRPSRKTMTWLTSCWVAGFMGAKIDLSTALCSTRFTHGVCSGRADVCV